MNVRAFYVGKLAGRDFWIHLRACMDGHTMDGLRFRSICLACLIEVGTSIPNLCIFLDCRAFILAMIMSRFLKVCGTHHANAGSSSMPLALSKSATSIGFDYLIKLSGTHCFVPSFHRISKFQPTVV